MLLFIRSLIQNPKCPCDCATVVTNIWVYYKFKKNLNDNLKESTLNLVINLMFIREHVSWHKVSNACS